MIGIKEIRGKKKIISNLKKIKSQIDNNLINSLTYGTELLRDRAIDNLRNLATEPGLSVKGGKITDKNSWFVEPITSKEILLRCTSEHASIVELGAPGRTILSTDYGWKGFPIGRQQGFAISDPIKGGLMYRKKVRLQSGYHYLQSAMDSQWVRESMLNRMSRNLNKVIEGIL